MHVSILLYDGVDLLDAGGPYEVFLTAGRLVERDGGSSPFDVDVVTLDGAAVTAYGGLGLVPTGDAALLADTDVLVVPGTIDPSGPLGDSELLAAIARVGGRDETMLASVCTGSFVLAAADQLDGVAWTTHWEDVDLLVELLGRSGARTGVRWVDAGRVVTGAGLSSGIAMALHLVERLAGRELAERTARQLDYEWTETTSAG